MARIHESLSASFTPASRSRSEVDDEEEEEEVSVDGQTPRPRKRARPSDVDEASGSESPERPLLPDNYRRSPRGASTTADGPHPHQPGSIVRVALTDFVTYTRAEFNLGPNLNMIIGPNGTGKSTLVCAICLGLGWETRHLGRAKDIAEFVKHGSKHATIEIELAADPARQRKNPVITTRISKESNKAEYLLDGKKSNKKQVIDFARTLSIQVDNLCQFLPQDRVVEFAALSPVALLAQTQRAAAPREMTDMHEELKELRKEQKEKQRSQETLVADLKNLENRQRLQQGDYQALQDRKELTERVAALEKFRPFPQYTVAKEAHNESRARKKDAERKHRDLEKKMAPNLNAVKAKETYLASVTKVAQAKDRLVTRSVQHAEKVLKNFEAKDTALSAITKELEAGSDGVKKIKQGIPKMQQTITGLRNAIKNKPAEIDFSAINEEIREKTRQSREADEKINAAKEQGRILSEQEAQRTYVIDQQTQAKESLQSQAGQQMSKLRANSKRGAAATAWEWIENNLDQFKGKVFAPPIMTCTVKNPKLAGAVESLVGAGELMAFTITDPDDFDRIQTHLYTKMKLVDVFLRQAPIVALADYRRPCSDQQLRQYGLDGWIVDLLDGPEEVLAMLCDNRMIHQNAYTLSDVTNAQADALRQRDSPITSYATATQTHRVLRRKEYGDQATSIRTEFLRAARMFTDAPVDRRHEDELNAKIRDAEHDLEELRGAITANAAELREHKRIKSALEDEKKQIQEDKNRKQAEQSTWAGLQPKLDEAEQKLETAATQTRTHRESQREITARGDTIAFQKGELILDYANSIDAVRTVHVQLFEAEIIRIEAQSDLEQLKLRNQADIDALEECRQEYEAMTAAAAATLAEGRRLGELCAAVNGDGLTELEDEVFAQVREWMPDTLETEIQSVQARLEMNTGGHMGIIKEYEDRVKAIDRARGKFGDLETTLATFEESIERVKSVWEPRLDALIAQISEAFAENFAQINCAGEVGVFKDEDFALWAVQIRVKFRESEPLSLLDSHRQSGGERAVSTIFYLMALQTLARAPFRVVDEINQGMDPRNERLVHSRMVSIACGQEGGSQYFLITPKLLAGLEYHRDMKVHCIASGEFMPDSRGEGKVDFGVLARRALEVRARAEGRV
ncbi:Structural maintenance of chromosomes protein 5 [Oleoguttula sp. CCFEE 5521]